MSLALLKTQPHQISNTQRTENKTTSVVIQQHSRKLLMMDLLMSETCWVHKKWNKIASDIKLVFYSSTGSLIYLAHIVGHFLRATLSQETWLIQNSLHTHSRCSCSQSRFLSGLPLCGRSSVAMARPL